MDAIYDRHSHLIRVICVKTFLILRTVKIKRYLLYACIGLISLAIVRTGLSGANYSQPFVSCQSTYLGSGWFQYEVTIHNDPFFQALESPSFTPRYFTNFLALGSTPANWGSATNATSISWSYTTNSAVPRPYNVTFLAQSTNTTFKEGELLFAFSVYPQTPFVSSPVFPVNIAGVVDVSGLVPCAPGDEDGSPSSLYSSMGLTPDIKIDDFLVVSNRLTGLLFSWDYESTMIILASDDFQSWTNVSYALGYTGQTTWTSSVPLDVYGKYFRINLFATEHRPELIE